MSTVVQTFVILGGVGGLLALQAFWIARSLDRLEGAVKEVRDEVAEVKVVLLRDHGERIARLEERITR